MKREALVIGINRYPYMNNLSQPAKDAEAVARLLENYGDFEVQRLPCKTGKREVNSKELLQKQELEAAIRRLFQPKGNVANTGILYFAGHGLLKRENDETQGFLATSESDPEGNRWGFSLKDLREILASSPVKQQVVWLDCCYSGEFLNFTETNLVEVQKRRDRCFIAASQDFELAYGQERGGYGELTNALLGGLDPKHREDGWVNNYTLTDFVQQAMNKTAPQHPVFNNTGSAIILTGINGVRGKICPYKGLEYFDFNPEAPEQSKDPDFFYGRSQLTSRLLDKVEKSNFLAVLGASGSGKSSVVRAGLLYQLYIGETIPGSEQWQIYKPFTPGEYPLQSLAEVLSKPTMTTTDFIAQIAEIQAPRTVITIDQFEEVFTLCQNNDERQEFFECLLDAVDRLGDKLCLVVVMRSDFQGNCAEQEYGGLVTKIDQNLVRVMPMKPEELREAITKPAELAGIEIEEPLVDKMIADVKGEAGGLPLLQYALTELWKKRPLKRWMLSDYYDIGGVEKALEKRADEVYESLSEEEQLVAKRIFLELTYLGDVANTRRRIYKHDLTSKQQGEDLLLEKVIQKLAAPETRLITTDKASKPGDAILDIAHEALIRHWQKLHDWVREYRVAMEIERKIESEAKEWARRGKPENYLLLEARLVEAEDYLENYLHLGLLDSLALEFIEESRKKREIEQQERERVAFLERTLVEKEQELIEVTLPKQAERVLNLLPKQPSEVLKQSIQLVGQNLEKLPDKILSSIQTHLLTVTNIVRVSNRCWGHEGSVMSVAISTDCKTIVSGSDDGTVRLWDCLGNPIGKPLRGHVGYVSSAVVSADGKTIVSGGKDGTVRLWNLTSNSGSKVLFAHHGSVRTVAMSADGKTIVSGGDDRVIRLWNSTGNAKCKPIRAHKDYVKKVAVSDDGKTIVSLGAEDTIRFWDTNGNSMGEPLRGYKNRVLSVLFSKNNAIVVTGSQDGTVCLWDKSDNPIGKPLQGHDAYVNAVAISTDGKIIVTGGADETIRLWDLEGNFIGIPIYGHKSLINSVAIATDGKTIISGSDDRTVRLWDISGNSLGEPLHGHEDSVNAVAIHGDRKIIISGSADSTIRLWNGKGHPIGNPFRGHEDAVNAIAISANGKMIVSGSTDGTVRLWDSEGNPIGKPLRGHERSVNSVAISTKGKIIVSGGDDKTVRLWSSNGNSIGKPLRGHQGYVKSVTISTDSRIIVSGSNDSTVRLWDSEGNPIGLPFKGHEHCVNAVAISTDNQIIVSGSANGTVRLWDNVGNPIGKPLRGHEGSVMSVAMSSDRKIIISGGTDGTVRLWDTEGNSLGEPFYGHEGSVISVAISTNGKTIVSGGSDGMVRLWQGGWRAWLEVCCRRLMYHLISETPEIDIMKYAFGVNLKEILSNTDLAQILLRQGNDLARLKNFELAIIKFQQAIELDSTLNLNPEIALQQWQY
jgi:WD40 repeat protein/energy-coupling factor transporter ATP-binding protein EcfA2